MGCMSHQHDAASAYTLPPLNPLPLLLQTPDLHAHENMPHMFRSKFAAHTPTPTTEFMQLAG